MCCSLLWNQTQTAWLLPYSSGDKNTVMWHQLKTAIFIVQFSQPSHSAVVGQEIQRSANTARRKSAFILHSCACLLPPPPPKILHISTKNIPPNNLLGGLVGKKQALPYTVPTFPIATWNASCFISQINNFTPHQAQCKRGSWRTTAHAARPWQFVFSRITSYGWQPRSI